jgi:hypothetical protein
MRYDGDADRRGQQARVGQDGLRSALWIDTDDRDRSTERVTIRHDNTSVGRNPEVLGESKLAARPNRLLAARFVSDPDDPFGAWISDNEVGFRQRHDSSGARKQAI